MLLRDDVLGWGGWELSFDLLGLSGCIVNLGLDIPVPPQESDLTMSLGILVGQS